MPRPDRQPVHRLHVRLYGRFRVERPDGTDLTPRAAKNQALLAMVLSADGMERGRGWLQDKLWSDRGQKQAADSFRQALVKIRKALGADADLLVVDRQSVRIRPTQVKFLRNEGPDQEFLEGIDVPDSEFNIWLASMRAHAEPCAGPPAQQPVSMAPRLRIAVLLEGSAPHGSIFRITEDVFIDTVARSLDEVLDCDVYTAPPVNAPPGLSYVSVQSFAGNGAAEPGLRVSLEDPATGALVWSALQPVLPVSGRGSVPPALFALGNQLVARIVGYAESLSAKTGIDTDASLLACQAVTGLFSMRREELDAAEKMLFAAIDLQERGLYTAWLAQLYAIQFVERFAPRDELIEKCDEVCARALCLEPNNSNVLAAVANARLVLEKNVELAHELSQMSVEANAANPLGWWALSAARLYGGAPEAAYSAASQGQSLAAGSRFLFWTGFQKSLTAVLTGRTAEAVRYGELSSALNPDFRAPHRYRTAVYATIGDRARATRAASQLTRLERDFTPERMAEDRSYPASLIHDTPFIDPRKLLLLRD